MFKINNLADYEAILQIHAPNPSATFSVTTAKMGRRAGANTSGPHTPNTPTSPEKENSSELNLDISLESTDGIAKGPPRRISGGWAESATKSGKSRGKNFLEDERFQSKTKTLEIATPLDDDIPIIPDLDDIQDELLMNEIIEPPSVSVNRVVTLKELNSDLLNQKAFSSLEDVDLSILTKCLQPQSQLEEPDESWEWEKIFTEVTAEIHSEKPSSPGCGNTGSIKNHENIDDVLGGHQMQYVS